MYMYLVRASLFCELYSTFTITWMEISRPPCTSGNLHVQGRAHAHKQMHTHIYKQMGTHVHKAHTNKLRNVCAGATGAVRPTHMYRQTCTHMYMYIQHTFTHNTYTATKSCTYNTYMCSLFHNITSPTKGCSTLAKQPWFHKPCTSTNY